MSKSQSQSKGKAKSKHLQWLMKVSGVTPVVTDCLVNSGRKLDPNIIT